MQTEKPLMLNPRTQKWVFTQPTTTGTVQTAIGVRDTRTVQTGKTAVPTNGIYGRTDAPTSPYAIPDLRDAIRPDILLGLVDGELVCGKTVHTASVLTPDGAKLIRVLTNEKKIFEIRYNEVIFSAARRTAIKYDMTKRIEMAEYWAKIGAPKMVHPKRRNPNKSHTFKERGSRTSRTRDPPTPISELEKWYAKRSEQK